MSLNLFEVFRSSFTLFLLLACSFVFLTFAIERWLFFKKLKLDTESFLETIAKLLEEKHYARAEDLCKSVLNPVAKVALVIVANRNRSRIDILELAEAARVEERLRLETHLSILGTLGNIAPFIGLFGTVVGIIRAFRDLALSSSGGPSIVAAGIAEALVATAGGLAVAIPSVILYNYYLKRVKDITVAMETTKTRVLVYLGSRS